MRIRNWGLLIALSTSLSVVAQTTDQPPGEVPEAGSIDEMFLFVPSGPEVGDWSPERLNFQDVVLSSTNECRIHAWYCPVQNPVATVLYLHGNAGNITHRSRVLRRLQNQLRVSVLIPDYRGFGKSTGLPSVAGALDDCRAARRYLAKQSGVNESDIVLLGRSLGGAFAIQLAAEDGCHGLIVESTFTSFRAIGEHIAPQIAWLVPPDKLNSKDAIRNYRGPLLQSHGTADRVIPYRMGRELYEAANKPKRFFPVPQGGHNNPLPVE